MGRVYAVVSAKGGVGKTTTAANVAAVLAADDSRVAVVDGDLGMANLAAALGVDIGEVTLHDVLAVEARSASDDAAESDAAADGAEPDDVGVAAAIHEGPHGLSVVPGSPALDAFSRADPERLAGVLDDLAADHDYVILDTGAGLSNDTVAPLTYVDEVLLVSTPTRDALRDTDKTRQVAERLGVTVAGAALLRADPSAAESDPVVETLDVGILGTVPDADDVGRASDAGEPLTTFAPESPAAAAFASLAAALTGEHLAAPAPADTDAPGEAATSADTLDDEGHTEGGDGEPDENGAADEEPDDEAAGEGKPDDEVAGEEPDDANPDEVPVSEVIDGDASTDVGAADPTAAVESGDSAAEAIDDASDSPVTPADPEAVAATGDTADADDEGVYTTPLEEVPIEEAADGNEADTDAGETDPPADVDGDEANPDDGDTDGSNADGRDNSTEDDERGDGGFFSRFFG